MRKHLLLVSILATVGGALLTSTSTHAVSNLCYFFAGEGPVLESGTCSIPSFGSYGTNDVLTGRDTSGNGNAVPASVNTKAELITFIQNRFNRVNPQDRIGAAFIIQEMRGGDRTWPNAADVQNWVDLMSQSSVSVTTQLDMTVGNTSYYEETKRNVFSAPHDNVKRDVIIIRQHGAIVAIIEYACGNLVAGTVGIVMDPVWNLSGTTSTPVASVLPGQPIDWTHTVRNNGPVATDATVTAVVHQTVGGVSSTVGTYTVAPGVANGSNVTSQSKSYTPTAADVGKSICQYISWSPDSQAGGSGSTSPECTNVDSPPVWNLDGTTLGPSAVSLPGQFISWTHIVRNNGPDATDAAVTAEVHQTVDGVDSVIGTYPVGAGIASGSNVTSQTPSYTPTGADVGKSICQYISWSPDSQAGGSGSTSPECTLIAKQPLAHVWGNDLRVGSAFPGGVNVNSTIGSNIILGGDNKYYGSWAEYGVVAPGLVSGFASGSGFANGNTSSNQADWSNLTFANTNAPNFGQFATSAQLGFLPDIRAYVSRFKVACNQNSVNGWPTGCNTVIVDGGNGTVNISANITRPTGYTSPANMPQMIIIANNINIQAGVTRIDAWLVAQGASGVINTCSNAGPNLTIGTCNQPLAINGPVIANRLLLRRTYGAEAATLQTPAETINLPADTYMWVHHQRELDGVIQTVYSRELPPKY